MRHKQEGTVSNADHRVLKLEVPSLTDITMEVDSIANRLESLGMGQNMIEIQNFFDRPMASITKFRRPGMIPNNMKDANGFFAVSVTSIDLIDTDNIIYSVVLENMRKGLMEYQQQLNIAYDDTAVPLVMSSEYAKSLMIAKVGDQWSRCIQVGYKDTSRVTYKNFLSFLSCRPPIPIAFSLKTLTQEKRKCSMLNSL